MQHQNHIVRSFCPYCKTQRAGNYIESDEYYHYYYCESVEVVQGKSKKHSFSVLTDNAKEIKNAQGFLAISALSIIVIGGTIVLRKRLKEHSKEAIHAALSNVEIAGAEGLTASMDISNTGAEGIDTETAGEAIASGGEIAADSETIGFIDEAVTAIKIFFLGSS